jgi:hypothetical protein
MMDTAFGAPERNYPALFLALDDVLEALDEGSPDDDVLRRSFEGSADGFGARKALLLMVDAEASSEEKRRLRALVWRGLSPEEVDACERGWSVPGVSSSCIRDAIVSGSPVLVQDAERTVGHLSEALRGQPYSVLCAPVRDPRTGTALAVLYVQNEGVRNAFGELDRTWIEVYARALGRAMRARPLRPAAPPEPAP